jgi:Uma2 family endonuclease
MINVNQRMMQDSLTETGSEVYLVLDVSDVGLTDDQFFRLCRDNEDFHIEMSAEGELIIMSPNRPKTGRKHARINYRLSAWADDDGTGDVYDATSEFTLPKGSKRGPDAAWILKSRWNSLTEQEQERFPAPICPDFVIEVRSPNDRMKRLMAKMNEYTDNGIRLGWLLDPIDNKALSIGPANRSRKSRRPES